MAGLTNEEKQRLFEHLDEIKQQQERTNQALFGDENIGLPGIVKDVQSLKHWRNEVAMRTSYIAGVVAVITTGITMFGKSLLNWLQGRE